MTGSEVRSLRKSLGLNQVQFAVELGVSPGTIHRWENDKVQPSPLALLRLESLHRRCSHR